MPQLLQLLNKYSIMLININLGGKNMKYIKWLLFGIALILFGISCAIQADMSSSDVLYVASMIIPFIGLAVCIFGIILPIISKNNNDFDQENPNQSDDNNTNNKTN